MNFPNEFGLEIKTEHLMEIHYLSKYFPNAMKENRKINRVVN